jgi:hypothetical protein
MFYQRGDTRIHTRERERERERCKRKRIGKGVVCQYIIVYIGIAVNDRILSLLLAFATGSKPMLTRSETKKKSRSYAKMGPQNRVRNDTV